MDRTRKLMKQVMLGTLCETEWTKLVRSAPSEDLVTNLWRFYEADYKWGELQRRAFRSRPETLENLKNRLLEKMYLLASKIAEQLEPAYIEWLQNHHIDNPQLWAEARVEKIEDLAEGDSATFWDYILSEYDRYARGLRFSFSGKMTPDGPPAEAIGAKIDADQMPAMAALMRQMQRDEMALDDEEGIETLGGDSLGDYTERVIEMFGGLYKFLAHFFWDSLESDIESVGVDVLREFVFPVWMAHWMPRGIEKTHQRISKTYDLLQVLENEPALLEPAELSIMMNSVVGATHQTGSMVDDYVSQFHDITDSDLEEMSNADTSEWDAELAELGVVPEQYATGPMEGRGAVTQYSAWFHPGKKIWDVLGPETTHQYAVYRDPEKFGLTQEQVQKYEPDDMRLSDMARARGWVRISQVGSHVQIEAPTWPIAKQALSRVISKTPAVFFDIVVSRNRLGQPEQINLTKAEVYDMLVHEALERIKNVGASQINS